MSERGFLPDPPDPTVVTKWMGQVRAWFSVAALLGIAVPAIPDAKLQAYVTTLIIVVGAIASGWSYFEKKWQGQKNKDVVVDSAVASAKIGVPVVVAVTEVTPPGQPNVGVAVPIPLAAEAMATIAPSPPGTTADDLNRTEARRRTGP